MTVKRLVVSLFLVAGLIVGVASPAQASRWAGVSPDGDADRVQQVVLRFTEVMVALGDARAAAPARLTCSGAKVPRFAERWQDERNFSFDFDGVLPPGVRCLVRLRDDLRDAAGNLVASARREAQFTTGGPLVIRTQPYEGAEIEEEQHFLLSLNGPVDLASIESSAYCLVRGIGERVPLRVVRRDPLLKPGADVPRGSGAMPAGQSVLVSCQRPLPSDAPVTLVWGKGIATQGGLARKTDQRLSFRTRAPFTASFSCDRAQPGQPCLPLSSLRVEFSSPIPRVLADRLVLRPIVQAGLSGQSGPSGQTGPVATSDLKPRWSRDSDNQLVSTVEFAPIYRERAQFQVLMPAEVRDASGRRLANADLFPLTVKTSDLPPLAKFAAAPFGIIEHDESPALPITLRNVEPDLNVRSMTATTARAIGEREIIQWFKQVNRYHEREIQIGLDAKKQPVMAATRTLSLFKDLSEAQGVDGAARRQLVESAQLSRLPLRPPAAAVNDSASGKRPFEVVGLPLPAAGFYVVEVESLLLGQGLLERNAPMYVRTSALVTNLAVHAKLGRENGVVWVTSLDRGRPVPAAQVRAFACDGQMIWEGTTDTQGLARIDRALPRNLSCDDWDGGLLISARTVAAGSTGADFSFVLTNWNQGIESWRFNVPTGDEVPVSLRAHTVFDRSLLRAGETVSMKHFVRAETSRGLAKANEQQLAKQARLVHLGSDQEYRIDLKWQAGRYAASRFVIPKDARLGVYQVYLERDGDQPASLLSGQFRVEQFRLPVLSGQIAVPKGTQVAVTELPVDLQVRYLSGGPAARLPVEVSALVRPRTLVYPDHDDFVFEAREANARIEQDNEAASAGPGEGAAELVLDRRALQLDGQGNTRTVIDGLRPSSQPRDIVIEATYNDPNGETQTLAQIVPWFPADVVVGIKAERWISVSDRLALRVVALTPAGQPKADVPVEIRAQSIKRSSSRKRLVGGLYSYENRREQVDLGVVCSGRTDGRGLFECSAPLRNIGEVILTAQARDSAQRVALADASVWVTGEGETWFEAENHDRIDLLPEKKRYEPGETARLQVRMPFREAQALVSIEREGIIDTQLARLSGRNPSIEVPIRDHYGPNVYVSVLVLRGRLREVPWYSLFTWGWRAPADWWQARQNSRDYVAPGVMVDLAKPAYKLGLAELKVGLAAHELKVAVSTDKPRYEVRAKAQANIRVTQANGTPAPAGTQVAVAVVDEALLELAENTSWRLLESLLQRRPYAIDTATAQLQVIGKRHFGRKAVAPGGAGGRAPTRELFDTLLLWREAVELDAQGQARIEIPLNDSLTAFRVMVIADSEDHRFGSGSVTFRTSQDLQILAGLPPLVRDEDKFDAMVTLRNGSDRVIKAQFAARSEAATTAFETTVELAAGQAHELHWPVTVPNTWPADKPLTWELSARDLLSDARDQVRISQRVVPALPAAITQASLLQLDAPLALPTRQPQDSRDRRGGVRVVFQDRLAGGLPAVRRYFETYPFVCLEQKTSKALGLADAGLWQQLIDELAAYLDADGLADYFPVAASAGGRPSGSEVLTAYLLSVSDEAGKLDARFVLPEPLRQRMERGLIAYLEGRIRRDHWAPQRDGLARRLAALEALSRRDKVTAALVEPLAIDPNQLPSHALIDWYAVLLRVPALPQRDTRLMTAEQVLRSRLSFQGNRLDWQAEERDHWWWLMANGDASAARLLALVSDLPNWKTDVPKLALGLLGRQQAGRWSTTNANLLGTLAIEQFSRRFEREPVAGTSAAVLRQASGTETARAITWSQNNRQLELPWPQDRRAAWVALAHDGSGKPWASVQTWAAVEHRTAQNAGFRLERRVEPVQQRESGKLSRGDVLRVRLLITPAAPANWVVVDDPVPSGATILGSGLGRDSVIATQPVVADNSAAAGTAWPAYDERTFEAYRVYYRWVPNRTFEVTYSVRLNNPGEFQLPPTRVEAMYNPQMFGLLPQAAMQVLR